MTAKNLLRFACAAAGAVLLLACASAGRPVNIILILVDDMGWTGPSCYGNRHVDTPNTDRLAAEGMKFTSAYTTPVCAPTRAEILSGKYSARTRITKAGGPQQHHLSKFLGAEMSVQLPFEEYTIAEALRDRGYATGHVGKWHVGIGNGNRAHQVTRPEDQARMSEHFGFDYTAPGEGGKVDKMVSDLTTKAIRFIERNAGQPFFLYLCHSSVHTEIVVPRHVIDKYLAKGYKKAGPDQAEGVHTADYFAMIDYLDQHIGRLLARLDELALADNTVVVFMSDNGGLTRVTRNDPLRRGKGMCYEGGIRVPFIVRWPGVVEAGSTTDVPVHSIDLYPTFLEIAGAQPKADHALDGASIVPLLTQSGQLPPRELFWHMPHYICAPKGFFGVTPHGAVRQGDFKLIEFFHDYLEVDPERDYDHSLATYIPEPRLELYNLKDDIGERNNLAAQMPDKTAALRRRLHEWQASVDAKMPRLRTVQP